MELLSAVIITFNEERNISRCLNSLLGFVDDIVVVDSFSTDQTIKICQEKGVRVIQNSFEGHIQQKNFAMHQAKNDWILSLDADEALTDELKNSILQVMEQPTKKGYSFNRLTNYCGKWVRHCGWYPDTKTRLVNRNYAKWGGVNPHDKLELNGSNDIGFLSGDLLHYSYYTKEDHYKQIAYFGQIAANELIKKGVRISFFMFYLKVIVQFFKSYFIKLGILDGITGIKISLRSAYATYWKYKLVRQAK